MRKKEKLISLNLQQVVKHKKRRPNPHNPPSLKNKISRNGLTHIAHLVSKN